MLPIEKTELGTTITILARGDETKAIVIKEPFITGKEKQKDNYSKYELIIH